MPALSGSSPSCVTTTAGGGTITTRSARFRLEAAIRTASRGTPARRAGRHSSNLRIVQLLNERTCVKSGTVYQVCSFGGSRILRANREESTTEAQSAQRKHREKIIIKRLEKVAGARCLFLLCASFV